MEAVQRKAEQQALDALRPGGLLHYDFRTAEAKSFADLPEKFRVVQWNIERGVQFDRIVQTLQIIKADIILLQEVDINCRRSGYRNVARDIAEALKMQIYFVCEFEELDAVDRPIQHAVGPLSPPTQQLTNTLTNAADVSNCRSSSHSDSLLAFSLPQRRFHGNAILSLSATLIDPFVLPHSAGIDWETKGWRLHEPRHGFRSVLRCRIERCVNKKISSFRLLLPDLYLYSCHFEVFCGILTRVRQLLDIFRDANNILELWNLRQEKQKKQQQQPAFLIAGDLNTVADGIVRFAWNFATDRMRFLSFGEREACWLQRNVLSRHMHQVNRECCCRSFFSYRYLCYLVSTIYDRIFNIDIICRLFYGFTAEEVAAMDNSSLCFYDPGDKALSVTLDNPAYFGFVRGKLDWMLLSNMRVVPPTLDEDVVDALRASGSILEETASFLISLLRHPEQQTPPPDGYILFNEQFNASDHKGLLLHVQQNSTVPWETYPEGGAVYTKSWTDLVFYALTRALPLISAAFWGYKKIRLRQKQFI